MTQSIQFSAEQLDWLDERARRTGSFSRAAEVRTLVAEAMRLSREREREEVTA